METKFGVCSIFKPHAALAKVAEDIQKFGKGLAKQAHIIIVGGPGIENDPNFNAERTSNMGEGFVDLFDRHDKPWMNESGRSMNLWLGWALMRHKISHIGVTDTSSIAGEDHTIYGLHLNSRLKRLTRLTAERVGGDHA
jgi:hypothetical protein